MKKHSIISIFLPFKLNFLCKKYITIHIRNITINIRKKLYCMQRRGRYSTNKRDEKKILGDGDHSRQKSYEEYRR